MDVYSGFPFAYILVWEVFVFDPLREHTTDCGFQLVAIFICFVSVVLFWWWWWSRCLFYCCFIAFHCKYLGEELLSSRVEVCLVFSFFLIRGTINVYVYSFFFDGFQY